MVRFASKVWAGAASQQAWIEMGISNRQETRAGIQGTHDCQMRTVCGVCVGWLQAPSCTSQGEGGTEVSFGQRAQSQVWDWTGWGLSVLLKTPVKVLVAVESEGVQVFTRGLPCGWSAEDKGDGAVSLTFHSVGVLVVSVWGGWGQPLLCASQCSGHVCVLSVPTCVTVPGSHTQPQHGLLLQPGQWHLEKQPTTETLQPGLH